MNDPARLSNDLSNWKTALVSDLERVALRDRWGLALMLVGWIHLAFFLTCQALFSMGDLRQIHYLALWGGEFAAILWVLRRVAGRGWHRSTPLATILVRVWATFLILSFNVASLNSLTGWTLDWFKPVWATLSTFGFATTAYLVNPWYFAVAVQMYFTGLLMVLNPGLNYLIYGASWWASLQTIGIILERRRRRLAEVDSRQPVEEEAASAAA